MQLEGKVINFLGDSITEGVGTSDFANKPYHQIIKRNYGLKEARNYGVGGTRLAKQHEPSANPRHDLDFIMRASEMADDAHAVVVFGGTNDFGHGKAPFGRFSDRTPDTFYGACHTLFTMLINKYPESRIIIMTPLHRTNEFSTNGDGSKPEGSHPLIDYVDAIKEVARYYSLAVIDLYATSGLQPNVDIIRERYVPDGLHPNDAGHEVMAEVIAQALLSL